METTNEDMTDSAQAREDIEFLVSSWNRLDILQTIQTGPRSRDELRESTSVSRVTLSRILSDLEDRGWIERTDGAYRTTSTGRYLATEVNALVGNVRTLNRLGENVEWIHLDRFDFDLKRLQDAEIIMPTWDDFSAQTRFLIDLVYQSSAIRGIGAGLDREFMRALTDATINGDLSLELIFDPDVLETINDVPELGRQFRDLTDSTDATIYRYGGEAELMELGIPETDSRGRDPVLLCGEYEEGAPPGTLKSTDPVVRRWAESYFETIRADAHRLKAGAFTP